MEETRIRTLLAKPFGPFRDSLILEKKCNTTGKESVVLSCLMMECGGEPIGFDESEFPSSDPGARINNYDIRFRGVVEIRHLDWLTPVGKKYLLHDIRKRDIDTRMHTHNNPTSDITLESIYRKEPVFKGTRSLTIKVLIQGEKAMTALFMTSDILPHGLLLMSKDQRRKFEVKSLDVETQSLSENFFMRYRLIALMKAIIDTDPDETDVEDRTIDYFVDGYKARFAAGYEEKNFFCRLIFDPDDPDVDSDGNTTQRRHLRPVHRAEVKGIFASQAEWILRDQLDRKEKNFLNVKAWHQFCRQAALGRREAKMNNQRWGRLYGEESDAYDSDDGGQVDFRRAGASGEQIDYYKRSLRRKIKKKPKQKSKSKAKDKGKQKAVSNPVSEVDEGEDFVIQPNTYDSDFSVASSPPASASEDDYSELENPDIAALIPPEFWNPPHPPGLDFRWHCPASKCTYSINMLNLNNENTKALDSAANAFLRVKKWRKITDAKVMKGFYTMVSDHYNDHMAKQNIAWENYGQINSKMVWTNPRKHRSWPPPKPKNQLEKHVDAMKQEDEVAVLTGTASGSRTLTLRPR